jgi:hypothetical protein
MLAEGAGGVNGPSMPSELSLTSRRNSRRVQRALRLAWLPFTRRWVVDGKLSRASLALRRKDNHCAPVGPVIAEIQLSLLSERALAVVELTKINQLEPLAPMRRPIKDEFTNLKVSRQRKYQLRMRRDRRCTECGEPAAQGSRCLKHMVRARERQRKKRGLKRRYLNTLSYRLEAMK